MFGFAVVSACCVCVSVRSHVHDCHCYLLVLGYRLLFSFGGVRVGCCYLCLCLLMSLIAFFCVCVCFHCVRYLCLNVCLR